VATVERRVGMIFGLFFVLLVVAAGRTVYLGVLRAGSLRKAASDQQLTYETLTAPRGTITDRNGVDLAVSEPAQEISADPYLIEKPLEDAHLLAPLLGETQASVLTELSQRRGFVDLAQALPEKQAQKVLALKVAGPNGTLVKMAGITGTPVEHRVYPRGTLAAQVLGVVGTEGSGLAGLEYSSNSVLKGRSGERRVVAGSCRANR
jgi:cell division protein FtsI/penicillin-binding protein 2